MWTVAQKLGSRRVSRVDSVGWCATIIASILPVASPAGEGGQPPGGGTCECPPFTFALHIKHPEAAPDEEIAVRRWLQSLLRVLRLPTASLRFR